jgi:hypothetical protein
VRLCVAGSEKPEAATVRVVASYHWRTVSERCCAGVALPVPTYTSSAVNARRAAVSRNCLKRDRNLTLLSSWAERRYTIMSIKVVENIAK